MERVLIVSKTRMKDALCVGGLTRGTNRNIRLLTAEGFHQPEDTRFNIGQVWDLEFEDAPRVTPPHVEDVHVTGEQYITDVTNIRALLLRRVQMWPDGPENLFDRKLMLDQTRGYIDRQRGVPAASTGFWLPNRPLKLTYSRDDRAYYRIEYDFNEEATRHIGVLAIRYVGVAHPRNNIAAHTLLRVSLSRWWVGNDTDEERCYLQLSGWYN